MRASALFLVVTVSLLLPACDSVDAGYVIGGSYSAVTEDLGEGNQTVATLDIPETASGETFAFAATVTETNAVGSTSSDFTGTGVYDHPAVTITVEGETSTGTVSDDGETLTIEIEPGDFADFERQGD